MRHVGQLSVRPKLLAAVAVLVVSWCGGPGASHASASHVSCGDTVTADTTLDSDLVNCPTTAS